MRRRCNILKPFRLRGQHAIICCAILWSTSGLFIKLVNWHPIVIAGMRSLTAAVFMLIVRGFFPPKKSQKNPPGLLWAGALVYSFTMLAFVTANKLTASANAIVLHYSAPIWAALLGWFLIKEKPRREHWGALVMILGGLFLLFKDGLKSGNLLGDVIAMFSGIFFGAHSVVLRMMKDGNPRDSMILGHGINFIIAIPFLFLFPPDVNPGSVLPILFLGIFQIGCASLLFAYGTSRISAIQVMIITMIEPVLSPLWVFLAIGEKPSSSTLIGGLIIIVAVAGSSIIGKRRELSVRQTLS
ncbi:DMT family transporter [Treponema primitia]|uniref:DMT family transporter n=1 Tax=Treponema primitia TaxID=88058 RepID=UPI0039804075